MKLRSLNLDIDITINTPIEGNPTISVQILRQDLVRGGGILVSTPRFFIRSERFPEIGQDGLFIRGRWTDKDDTIAQRAFLSKKDVDKFLENLQEAWAKLPKKWKGVEVGYTPRI